MSVALMLAFFLTQSAEAQHLDTAHLFGFMIGTDVGELGDKEIDGETVTRWGKAHGSYGAAAPAFEAEFVPIENVRVAQTIAAIYHDSSGGPGLENRASGSFDSLSFDARYRLLDRGQSGIGLAFDAEPHWGIVDATTGEHVDRYGTDFSIMIDRELVPDRVLAAVNLVYQPEATHLRASNRWARDAVLGPTAGLMLQIAPGVLVGTETRYLRAYNDFALSKFAGQALFLGPTVYARLSQRLWVIAAWSRQIAGHAVNVPGSLDLTNFERNQAKVQFGLEF